MLKSNLCNNIDVYILVKRMIIVAHTSAAATATNNSNEKAILKNCAPLTDCISEIKNINAKDLNPLMPVYN